MVALQGALHGRDPHTFAASDEVASRRDLVPGLRRPDVVTRVGAVTAADRQRESRLERQTAQRERLHLPLLPTTTIGSFPQTREVRVARGDFAAGRSDLETYTQRMQAEIRGVIALQERIGLDVLVHGEPERNDMVQYFAKQLDGYASTRAGWVQSYGSRCVRPPILYGDVHRPEPMLPLRAVDHREYLEWSVGAFQLATSSIDVHTQLHTHLCYSKFGEIIEAIDGLNADVTSVEAARSDMELLASISENGFDGDIGPGVYDIHSPRVPDRSEVEALIGLALASVPAERLWINPDCGLKTRGYAEVELALAHMVEAATTARAGIAKA